jgi:hypothetical protein
VRRRARVGPACLEIVAQAPASRQPVLDGIRHVEGSQGLDGIAWTSGPGLERGHRPLARALEARPLRAVRPQGGECLLLEILERQVREGALEERDATRGEAPRGEVREQSAHGRQDPSGGQVEAPPGGREARRR